MRNLVRILLAVLVVVGGASCGVGLEDTGGDSARDQKNEKLRDEYEAIKGTYEGMVRISGTTATFPVKLYLFWSEVQEAPLPGDLKPGIRVVLRGRLMQSNYVGDSDNLILQGQYDSITGRLVLEADEAASKTSTGCRLGGQDPISISATIGSGVSGVIFRNEQEWARFENMKFVTRDVSGGSILSEEQEYRRLQTIFEPVTGTYEGELSRRLCSSGPATKEPFRLLLYIERRQEGTGLNGAPCYVPRLMTRTLRNFDGELADVKYKSVARFDPSNFLPQFQSETIVNGGGASGGGNAGGDNGSNNTVTSAILELDTDPTGTDQLVGSIVTTGQWGQIKVKRIDKAIIAPNDELVARRERRARTYAPFYAEYKGSVAPYDKTVKVWKANLKLYPEEGLVGGVRVPVMMAYYTRENSSNDPTIGARLMQVEVTMDACKPLLIMHSEADPGPIPGKGRMHFSSPYENGTLKGELVDHRGPQGVMTVKR
ncbi:MAG: hypothetical protein KF799_13545 [Bdellovibrionales bacterium]|nr:hypothetical protein [Bdellovibrionales bacterium]